MITAVVQNNKIVFASEELKSEKKGFYRNRCNNEPVFLKKGLINKPHFSHYPGSVIHGWESESDIHIDMKLYIYNLFKNYNWVKSIDIEKPVFLKDNTFLEPDIFIETYNNRNIAIECQVSNYSREKYVEKVKKYSGVGIFTLFVFSVSNNIKAFIRKNVSKRPFVPFVMNRKIEIFSNYYKIKRYYFYNNNSLFAVEHIVRIDDNISTMCYYNYSVMFSDKVLYEEYDTGSGVLLLAGDNFEPNDYLVMNAIERKSKINAFKG